MFGVHSQPPRQCARVTTIKPRSWCLLPLGMNMAVRYGSKIAEEGQMYTTMAARFLLGNAMHDAKSMLIFFGASINVILEWFSRFAEGQGVTNLGRVFLNIEMCLGGGKEELIY